MNVRDVYLRALQKTEINKSNGGISLDHGRFVRLFNAQQLVFLEDVINMKNDDTIRIAQKFLVTERDLSLKRHDENVFRFGLPNDYFRFSDIRGYASKEMCSNVPISLWEAKGGNINTLLSDEFNKPSFDYLETFYTIGGDSVNVYVDDFRINSVLLNYFRLPVKIDMSGINYGTGGGSSDVDPEFDDDSINKILNLVALEFSLNEHQLQKHQFDVHNTRRVD